MLETTFVSSPSYQSMKLLLPTPQNRFALFCIFRDKDGSKCLRLVIAQTQEWAETANHSQFREVGQQLLWASSCLRNHLPLALGLCLNPVTAVILSLLLSCNLTAAPQRYADSFKAKRCAGENVSKDRSCT